MGTGDPAAPYDFVYGKGKGKISVRVARKGQKFVAAIDRVIVEGTLSELKTAFTRWAPAAYHGTTPTPPASETEAGARVGRSHIERQRSIDEAYSRTAQIVSWCQAYNEETVAARYGAVRHVFTLPPGPPPVPSLESCYNPFRRQYIWPMKYKPEEIENAPEPHAPTGGRAAEIEKLLPPEPGSLDPAGSGIPEKTPSQTPGDGSKTQLRPDV